MPTYIYQFSSEEDRGMIDTRLHDGWEDLGRIEARDWLHAKAGFGFDLTPLQQRMLPLDRADRARMQSRDSEYGRAA